MLGNITLDLPTVIEFGVGKINTLPHHLQKSDRIFLLIDGPVLPHIEPILETLKGSGHRVEYTTEIVPEPPIESLEELLSPVKDFGPDAIVGIGGGSTMDLAKLVSVLFTGEQATQDIIGIDNVSAREVKLITASTTSGTGSEVTPIAVLTDTKAGLKKGVVSSLIVPDVAIVDPELTVGMPPLLTAVTGMDAITHCIEAYTNRNAHPIIDSFALQGIKLMFNNLEMAVTNSHNMEAREAMALGSLYGGLCLGPVNTAAVHALAYPLGGVFKISHGMSNSVLLPYVMDFNLPACASRYADIGREIGFIGGYSPADLAQITITAIQELSSRCGIPGNLKELEIPWNAIPEMAKAAMEVTRLLGNNPRELRQADAEAIYTAAYNGKSMVR